MNKRLTVRTWGLLCLWILGTPVFGQNALERISSSGIVRIGIPSENFPPYYQQNEAGEWEGEIFPALFQLASRLQATPVFVSYESITRAQQWLYDQSLDVFFFPPQMETSELFTFPFFSIPMGVLVSHTTHPPRKDHDSKRMNELLLSAKTLSHKIKEAENQIALLKSGEMSALIAEEKRLLHYFHSHPTEALTLRSIALNAPQFIKGVVSAKDDFFLDWLMIALEEMNDSNGFEYSQRQGEQNE